MDPLFETGLLVVLLMIWWRLGAILYYQKQTRDGVNPKAAAQDAAEELEP